MNMISKDQQSFENSKTTLYIVCTMIPLFLCAFFILNGSENPHNLKLLMIVFGVLSGAMFLIYFNIFSFFWYIFETIKSIFSYVYSFLPKTEEYDISDELKFIVDTSLDIVSMMIVFIGLTLAYHMWNGTTTNLHILSYLPCLLTDFIDYMKKDYKNTPSSVFILFVIEIILIALVILIPYLFKSYVKTGKRLLSHPHFITTPQEIGNDLYLVHTKVPAITRPLTSSIITFLSDPLATLSNPSSLFITKKIAHKDSFLLDNYCVSFWLNVNVPSTSEQDVEYPLFFIGNTLGIEEIVNGYPYVALLPNGKVKFSFTDVEVNEDSPSELIKKVEDSTIYMKMPFQTWNYVVINYNSHKADVFINGHLEDSRNLTSLLPFQTNKDDVDITIQIGHERNKNNVHGAICNVNIFQEPITHTDISRTYNVLKMQNPPVNNL